MVQDFLGRILQPGDSVVYTKVNSGTLCQQRREIQRIENGHVYLVPVVTGWRDGQMYSEPDYDKRSTQIVDHRRLIKYIL